MKLNNLQRVFLGFYICLVIFWAVLFFFGIREGFYNYLYSFLFGLIPLIGGIISMINSRVWGGLNSSMGKSIFFIGLGVFCWGIGELIWSYYNFVVGVPAPYPSLADVGFAPSIFFYGLGAFYLSRATGAKFGLRTTYAKVFVVLALVSIIIFSYYILVIVARGGVLLSSTESGIKVILDIAYPLGDLLSLLLAVVISGLSFRYIGGMYRFDIYAILLGLAVMFIADSVFSYTTTVGTYYNANFGDLLLTTGTFLLTFGCIGFYKSRDEYLSQ
ncbi:hypothetical protein KW782_00440 [Candidatus Parcubacteria bacterium]|nr:hypothetical protein [Candidatus Parcubacteria bacterium]